jgi:hypothetical protein
VPTPKGEPVRRWHSVQWIAHCCCGSLRAETTGEPAFVGACQVRTEGPSKVYARRSDSGRKIEIHFCPRCGSSVFWYGELYPDLIGIAFGALADPSMPAPTLSVWEATQHPWVTFDHPIDRFTDQLINPATLTATSRRPR